jgi:hypothetical protein
MEITYSNIKNIDQNSTAGNIVRDIESITKKISPSIDVSSETAISKLPIRREGKKPSTPSPMPASK